MNEPKRRKITVNDLKLAPRTTPKKSIGKPERSGVVAPPPAKPPPSAEPTAPSKDDKLTRAFELLDLLAKTYPVAFGPRLRPLAIGVRHEIETAGLGLGFTKGEIKRATALRLHSDWYLSVLATPGAMRVALDGSDAGEVSEEHRASAALLLAERKAKRAKEGPRSTKSAAL
jgi:sRNA-binding protein